MKPTGTRFLTLLTLALFFWTAAVSAFAQSPRPQTAPACPSIKVLSPDSVNSGQALAFTAAISGGDPNVTPTFNWTVSAGSIESGQGTSSIKVDTTGIQDMGTVTATVDVGGFARNCEASSSSTTSVMKKAEPSKFDEYGKIRSEDEHPRLDDFAVKMNSDPATQGYLIFYGGRRSKPGDARKAANASIDYLVKKRAIAPSRLITIDGGYREEPTVELWIVPSGAIAPTASPTVDPSEVQPAKTPVKSTKTKQPNKTKPVKGKKS